MSRQHHDRVSVPATKGRQRVRAREWPRLPRRDPHIRVTAQVLEMAGSSASVAEAVCRPWASATFLGARHRISVRFSGPDHACEAEAFANSLPEAEFSIPGHIVADACVDAWEGRELAATNDADTDAACGRRAETLLHLSILTVEDW